MYTQCPDCSTSFRVTAEILRRAAGKVRCGGCGNAFNALAHLSETKPERRQATPKPAAETPLDADTRDARPPTAISPEHSAALLKTLDKLAGDDVRLEDTGIEWRVLDDEQEPGQTESNEAALDGVFDANNGTERVDEILTSTATPVDEVLDPGGGAEIESAEVFDAGAGKTVPDEELRFDDNTGLPEGFDDEESSSEAVQIVPEPSRDAPEPMANLQVDLGFSDEWQDLLDEVGPRGTAAESSGQPEPTLADELEALEVTSDEVGDVPDGDELASRMEALSQELSGIQEELDMLASPDGEPSFADELEALDVATDDDEYAETQDEAPEDEAEPDLDEAYARATAEDAPQNVPGDDVPEDELELSLEADDALRDDVEDQAALVTAMDDLEDLGIDMAEDDTSDVQVESGESDRPEAPGSTAEEADSDDATDRSIDEDLIAAAFETERAALKIETAGPAEQHVEPLSEEEETINRLIDQDLMALAIEDEDGFASTMVFDDAAGADPGAESAGEIFADSGMAGKARRQTGIPTLPLADAEVEEIVMEGSVARSGTDLEGQEAEEAALKEEAAALIAAATADEVSDEPPVQWHFIAGIGALGLLLVMQGVHFSRDALARVPALYDIIAPVYASLGAPLTPDWDVTGWRFEATRGSTDETGAVLSIYSRIGNKAESALPYPVISVSLTDRFEETIGSRVFKPGEYLADDRDTERMVEPGTTFNALMSIESPAAEATGFKLNVCYRLADGKLKCAIEDFK